jgi:DNA uptake protein ComE-like DNA-binding protein
MRYGLTDEASKLNLNTATQAELLRIPGIDQNVIDALGGKSVAPTLIERLNELNDSPKGEWTLVRHLQNLGELLSFSGFTPQMVYGEDANCNLRLDPNEDDGDARPPADNHDGKLDLGLFAYLTVNSYDVNLDSKGVSRIDINGPLEAFPETELPAGFTNYIMALRTNSVRIAHPADLLESKTEVKDENGKPVELASGVRKAELAQIVDSFYGTSSKKLEGLINVNTASIKVLAALPGMDEPLAEAIVSGRRGASAEKRNTIAWLYEEGVLDAEHFKRIAPLICARSFQFSFHVVGFSLPSRKFRALEVGIDVAEDKHAVIYLRDLTKLGLPLEINDVSDQTKVANVRSGLKQGWNRKRSTHG